MQREKPKPEARTFPTLPKIKRRSSKPVAEVKPTVKKRTSIVPKVEQLHHKIFIMSRNMFIKAQTSNTSKFCTQSGKYLAIHHECLESDEFY